MIGRSLLGVPRYPLRLARSLPAAVPHMDETPLRTLPGAGLVSSVTRGVADAVAGVLAQVDRTDPDRPIQVT